LGFTTSVSEQIPWLPMDHCTFFEAASLPPIHFASDCYEGALFQQKDFIRASTAARYGSC
jgi:hypothetical protein